MIKLTKTFDDPSGSVKKLIFEDSDAIAEAVVYKYEDRGVVCFSVQSGCPVGCVFCGTGKKFIRNLTCTEIMKQIDEGLGLIEDCKKKQLMSMSMGEPMLNHRPTLNSAEYILMNYEDCSFYVSTVGIRDLSVLQRLLYLGEYEKFGLQFSLHHWNDSKRRKLLGSYKDLMSINEVASYARFWSSWNKKPVYFNYICTGKETSEDVCEVANIVRGNHLTCSVKCKTKDFAKGDPQPALDFADRIMGQPNADEIDVSVFDPAGQDTIGGGCGQLLYTQEKFRSLG